LGRFFRFFGRPKRGDLLDGVGFCSNQIDLSRFKQWQPSTDAKLQDGGFGQTGFFGNAFNSHLEFIVNTQAVGVCFFLGHDFDTVAFLKLFAFFNCNSNRNTTKDTRIAHMTTESKTLSIKIPSALAARTEALKEKTGISEAAILRQAITAGIGKVEEAIDLLHEDLGPADQAVS